MSFLFGSKKPKAQAAPARPTLPPAVPPAGKLKADEKKKIRKGVKRGTLFTGSRGLLGKAPVETKTLLGE